MASDLKAKWIAPHHDIMILGHTEEEILAFRRAERARITAEVERAIREDMARWLGLFIDEKTDKFITSPSTIRRAVWADWVPAAQRHSKDGKA